MIDYQNTDCMIGMAKYPDQFFELAIVDPPYGIGCMSMNYTKSGAVKAGRNSAAKRRNYRRQEEWDVLPEQEYFDELFRVSKNQIIWGANNFLHMLPPTRGFICWDKRCSDAMRNDFSDCELAWCSTGVARMFRYVWNGMIQGDMKDKEERIHPTQKPVALYKWCLANYAKPGDCILDTHVGSGSSLVACHEMKFHAVGFEIDEEYFQKSSKRLKMVANQIRIDELGNQPAEQLQLWEET